MIQQRGSKSQIVAVSLQLFSDEINRALVPTCDVLGYVRVFVNDTRQVYPFYCVCHVSCLYSAWTEMAKTKQAILTSTAFFSTLISSSDVFIRVFSREI